MQKQSVAIMLAFSMWASEMEAYFDNYVWVYPIVNIAESYSLRLVGVQHADATIPALSARNVAFPISDTDDTVQDISVEALDVKGKVVASGVITPNPGTSKKQKGKLKDSSAYGFEVQVGYFATGVSGKPTIRITPLDEKKYKSKKYPNLKNAHDMVALKGKSSTSSK